MQQKRAEEKKRKASKSVYDMDAHRPMLPANQSNLLGSKENSRHYRNQLSREPENHAADAFVSDHFHSPHPIKSQRVNEDDDDDDVIFVSPPPSRNDQLKSDVDSMKMAVVHKLLNLK